MSVRVLVTVNQYLNTADDPEMEYVDGVLVERPVGDLVHALVQANVIAAFARKHADVYAVPELRSKTDETRFRLPDVCVVLRPPSTKYLVDAAFIVIEILSEEDAMSRTLEKLGEYRRHGVLHIWLISARLRKLFSYAADGLQELHDDVIATSAPRLELTRDDIFRRLPYLQRSARAGERYRRAAGRAMVARAAGYRRFGRVDPHTVHRVSSADRGGRQFVIRCSGSISLDGGTVEIRNRWPSRDTT